MDLSQINEYLLKLEGPADIEKISADKFDISGTVVIKFNGDIGTKDKGEVELEFSGVDSMRMPFRMLAPVKIELLKGLEVEVLDSNYIESDLNFYQLIDDVGAKWWIYAKSMKAKILPIYYGQ